MQEGKTVGEESDELVQFRKQWIEEVRSKKQGPSGQDLQNASETGQPSNPSQNRPTSSGGKIPTVAQNDAPLRQTTDRTTMGTMLSDSNVDGAEGASSGTAPLLQRAVAAYSKAVECEQRSELDLALQFYRTAFRLDPNVHLAYQLVEDLRQGRATAATAKNAGHHHKKTISSSSAIDGLTGGMRGLGITHIGPSDNTHTGLVVTGSLRNLISSWPVNLSFESPGPEDTETGGRERHRSEETRQTTIGKLSDELLLMILSFLDYNTLERFAVVNRKARVITLEGSLWRPVVEATYKPPQIPEEEDYAGLMPKYMSDYRRIYVEHPRVRYDGVYIAMCNYVRNGLGVSAWVNCTHTVTYYRYLRFYPDGVVLSLLANEDLAPAQVVPILKQSLRLKGFSIGTWYLRERTVHVDNLLEPSTEGARYSFQMVLDLRSRPLGRWNRLDFRAYDSVHLSSGEAMALPLKHERSFWFSKVHSYAVSSLELSS